MNRLSSILASAALLFAACADGTPTTPMDAANVSVVATFPASAATNAPRNAAISATFGTAMSAARIDATTFTLRNGATPVAGTVTFTPTTATFVPSEALAAGTSYTAAISTNVSSFANGTGASGGSSTVKVWSFTTESSLLDARAPVDLGTAADFVIFAKHAIAMNCESTVNGDVGLSPMTSGQITGFDLSTATSFATSPMVNGRVYAADYQGSTPAMLATAEQDLLDAIADAKGRTNPDFTDLGGGQLNGNTLVPGLYKWNAGLSITGDITLLGDADDIWIFQVGAGMHVGAGVTVTLAGGAQAKNVFWQVTDDVTLGANSTFQGIILSGSIIWINDGAKLIGRALAYSEVRLCGAIVTGPGTTPTTPTDTTTPPPTDTTTPPPTDTTTPPTTPLTAVDLRTAGGFCILAKTGVSTTGLTSILGDVGLSPAAASGLTGFSLSAPPTTFTTSPRVTGQLFAADYDPPTPARLTLAVLDMEAAYTEAANRPNPNYTNLGAGSLTQGQTLAPGLYKWTSGLSIAGDVTLAGGANDVWIFQIAQDLTVGSGARVTLTGGAQAKNVFWQVGGQATLGTTSEFKGYILSKTLIAFNTGARIDGCALAQTAVTLDATTVTRP